MRLSLSHRFFYYILIDLGVFDIDRKKVNNVQKSFTNYLIKATPNKPIKKQSRSSQKKKNTKNFEYGDDDT